jgi:hypothetical protein
MPQLDRENGVNDDAETTTDWEQREDFDFF